LKYEAGFEEKSTMVLIKNRLLKFFEAENRRDWETYEGFLSPDVEWVCYDRPHRTVIKGRTNYLVAMKNAYKGRDSTFRIINLAVDEQSEIAMAELEIDGRRSVDIFEFKDGFIHREREYFDTPVG
jgi:ketosteroid isomerase-like protein